MILSRIGIRRRASELVAEGYLANIAQPVAEYDGMDRERFWSEVLPKKQPAILRGLVRHWPAVEKGQEGAAVLIAHLHKYDQGKEVEAFFGDAEMQGRFFHDESRTGFNFEKRTMRFAAFLDALLAGQEQNNSPCMYAGAVNLPKHLPMWQDELQLDLLPDDMEQLVSLWIGRKSRTAAHWDLPQNFACVLSGHRRFTVFPPEAIRGMYMGSFDFTLAGRPISLVDMDDPDLEQHPQFAEIAPLAQVAELEPGDVFYLPSLWLHMVETDGPFGAMVNFWWREGPAHLVTPQFTMLHALLTLKGLPPDELAAWKHMFDHFVFETNGDPFAHLPAAARGVFGDLTPAQRQNLRQFLASTLR